MLRRIIFMRSRLHKIAYLDFDKALLLNKEHQKHVEDINQVLKALMRRKRRLCKANNDKRKCRAFSLRRAGARGPTSRRNTHKARSQTKILAKLRKY